MDTESNRGNSALTLRQMLGGDITFVIPDMQRDYCWGVRSDISPMPRMISGPTATDNNQDKRGKGNRGETRLYHEAVMHDKVSVFLLSILHLYQARTATTLGLLYGYEYPKGSNQIMIIDGQQRLTTMYLLIGMLYRRTPREDLRRLLISDYKLMDDCEPRLLYQVRSDAMYFMSDLVIHFFLDRNGRLSALEKSPWYCAAYDSDPTVQSFIAAIRSIDRAIEDVCEHVRIDFDDFADFVADSLIFFYHDIGERPEAEDMFITINTTGEPLTPVQNLKSMLMAFSDSGESIIGRFEEIEGWAWRNRPSVRSSQPFTSDFRFEQLIRIYDIYTGFDRRVAFDPANFHKIYDFFLAYRSLTDFLPHLIDYNPDSAEDMFVIVPAVAYVMRWGIEGDGRTIHDFVAYLTNLLRYQRVSPAGTDMRAAMKLVDKMVSPEIISIPDIKSNIPDKILPMEERLKMQLVARYPEKARKIRKILSKAEKHPLLTGNVSKVISWCKTKRTGDVDISRLASYIESIYEIWGKDIDRNTDLDCVRIALLTLRHPAYPIVRRGDTNLSLCWNDYDWQRLMATAPGIIRLLIDSVCLPRRSPIDVMRDMAAKFSDRSYPFYFLVKSPALVSECARRSLFRPCSPFLGYHIREKSKRYDDVGSKWYVDQRLVTVDDSAFSDLRTYGSRSLFTEHRELNVGVSVFFTPDSTAKFRVELFSRDDVAPENRIPMDLRCVLNEIQDELPVRFGFDKKRRRFFACVADSKGLVSLFHRILEVISAYWKKYRKN